jgi:hypothetical protein
MIRDPRPASGHAAAVPPHVAPARRTSHVALRTVMTRLLAFFLSLAAAQPAAGAPAMTSTPRVHARVAVFYEAGFPAVDAVPPDIEALRNALAGFDVAVIAASELATALQARGTDVLLLPFGSAFPRAAWPAILAHLARGGGLVNLGGVPFAVPVVRQGTTWRALARTTAYHKQVGIVQAFPVDASRLVYRFATDPTGATGQKAFEGAQILARETHPRRIYELIVRFTTTKSFPDEDGSDGPREARLNALVQGYPTGTGGNPSERSPVLPVATPFLEIDRLEGAFAGGRWVLFTGDGPVSEQAAAALVGRSAADAVSMRVQPRYAGFHPGESIAISVNLRRPNRPLSPQIGECDVQVIDARSQVVARGATRLAVEGDRAEGEVVLPATAAQLARGSYTVVAAADGETAVSGFWIYDTDMLRGGPTLAVGRDYFTRDGHPFPVTGTTYMATDVHRRFLLEPNPAAWERDFAAMEAAGVNLVRTGIWTGWRLHADGQGAPTEGTLRALEVFLLTARRHDMPVIFTLFAFVPATWSEAGLNPYFAPAALAAQRRFAGGIAARLAGANDIAWDLINEPSFSSPERLWSCRPNYDADEQAAWEEWIRETAGPDAAQTTLEAAVCDRWNSLPGEGLSLPRLEDFGDKNLFGATRPNKAADYKRFAQAAFTRWVRDISGAIRANGNRAQLITVGQDEGGATERPNPLLFGEAVDFTGTHTWWNNDALLWDALVSKRPDRAALVGETGLMTYERLDGGAWRDETAAHNLLERKLALAFAGGGAGFVQWLWNTNVYMPIDNEAGIGFLRADGTVKPEFDAFGRLARFVGRHRDLFQNRTLEDVVVVVPQSQLFSVRDFAAAATQRAVRTLEYELGVPVRMVGEHATGELKKGARLVIVPSPRVLTDDAWSALMAAADAGATVLVTGPVDRDEYERRADRLTALAIGTVPRPVAPVNTLQVGGARVSVVFRGAKLERLERSAVVFDGLRAQFARGANAELAPAVRIVSRGKGRFIVCPLPVELADNEAATTVVYREALRAAGLGLTAASNARQAGVLLRPLVFDEAVLFVVVNERDTDTRVALRLPGGTTAAAASITVPAERAALVLVDRRTGQIMDSSR